MMTFESAISRVGLLCLFLRAVAGMTMQEHSDVITNDVFPDSSSQCTNQGRWSSFDFMTTDYFFSR